MPRRPSYTAPAAAPLGNPAHRSITGLHPIHRGPVPVTPPAPVHPIMTPTIFIGLDLGQLVDPSAASVVRRDIITDAVGLPTRNLAGHWAYRFTVIGLRRFPLHTPYTHIVNYVKCNRPPGSRLVIDATGVGRPIVEMFRDAMPFPAIIDAVTITGGQSWSLAGPGEWHCSKVELVAASRVVLESTALKVIPSLEHASLLKRELLNFRIKVAKTENETYEAREGDHDDLVISVCLPVWISHVITACITHIVGSDSLGAVAGPAIGRQPGLLARGWLGVDSGKDGESSGGHR